MTARVDHETVIRARFTQRLTEWWQETDPEIVAKAVDELLTDLGYVIKPASIRKTDPVGYQAQQRVYMREYYRRRRAKAKATAGASLV